MRTDSPLAQVKKRFGSKEKLVEALRQLATEELWLDRLNPDKGLECVSNKKLLHLYDVLTEVKERFGSRAKLIDAVLELENRSRDRDYRRRFERWPLPRLWDYYRAAQRRHKAA